MVPNAAAPAEPKRSVGPGDRLGTDGRYELIARVGTGGMGSVFRARDHKLGCERAIKVLYPRFARIPAFVERFRREAMAASRISHPNIVGVVDVAGADEPTVYLVMELLEGRSLAQLVRGGGTLPWSKVRGYVDQIAAGLGAAHAQGVVHRDVKPGNCVVLAGEQVKVLDFGIAKVTDMPAELVPLTAAGEIIGTCSYMAPEQIRGKVDPRSDIYALGAVIYRLLTGHTPFEHDDQDQVLLAHLKAPPPRPSDRVPGLPEGVDDLVTTMLAKSPQDRFADMEALRRALGELDQAQRPRNHRTLVPGRVGGGGDELDDAPTESIIPGEGTLAGGGEETIAGLVPDEGPETNVTARAGSGALAELEAHQSPAVVLPGQGLSGPGEDYDPEEDRETNEVTPYDEAELAAEPKGSSGTVAMDADSARRAAAVGPAGTMVLQEEGSGGGTLVVDGYQQPAKVPDAPGGTELGAAPPKVMGPLSAPDAAPPRKTRAAVPEPEESPGVLRGLMSALGGIALAGVVVAVWLFTRGDGEAPAAPPAAASMPAAVDPPREDSSEASPTDDAKGASDPAVTNPGTEPEAPKDVAPVDPPTDDPEPAVPPEPTEPEAGPGSGEPAPPTTEPKPRTGKKRRNPKTKPEPGSTKPEPEPAKTEPDPPPPDPEPDPKEPGGKSGDLRDPF